MQQQDNHEYPFLYQRQTCHQVQPNQATYQKRQKCQPATYLQEVLYLRKFDLSLRSSRSSYFATFRHQLTILSKTDALDEEKWLNMLGTFVKDWFRYESHFVHGRDSL